MIARCSAALREHRIWIVAGPLGDAGRTARPAQVPHRPLSNVQRVAASGRSPVRPNLTAHLQVLGGERVGDVRSALDAIVVRDALRALAERYAQAVDHRDRDRLLTAFVPDATLEVRLPNTADDERLVMRGHAQVGLIIDAVSTYPKTMHVLGQSTYELDGDQASGEVYCLAHHLDPGHNGASNYVMYVRYEDRYRCTDDQWQIESRRVNIEWTDRRIADVGAV